MDSLISQAGSWTGILGTIGLTLATYLSNRYIIPFLSVGKRQRYAQYIGAIADELTDELRTKYPERDWLKHLDEAIDSLISICGISNDVAQRAVKAAAARK